MDVRKVEAGLGGDVHKPGNAGRGRRLLAGAGLAGAGPEKDQGTETR